MIVMYFTISRVTRRLARYVDRLRIKVYKPLFTYCGPRCSVGTRAQISNHLQLNFGEKVTIRPYVSLLGRGEISIGSNTTINQHTILSSNSSIKIGADCMIAPYCLIIDVDHAFDDITVLIREQGYKCSDVEIGDNVWIGAHSLVTRGVTIGNGAVVGANSLVNKNVPSNAIVGGSPAKILRFREIKEV